MQQWFAGLRAPNAQALLEYENRTIPLLFD
jgi:hypothetical protein